MKKKILFPFDGNTIGGSHLCALKIISFLKKNKDFFPVIVLDQNGIFSTYLKKKKINYHVLNTKTYDGKKKLLTNIFNIYFYFFKRLFFLLKHDIKIVHCNEYRVFICWVLPAKLAFQKIINHCRSPLPISRLLKFKLRMADKLIFISKFVKKDFLKKKILPIYYKKYVLIYDWFEIKNLKIKINEKFNIVAFFGNFKETKRPIFFF